jgi:hypothetical protein
MGTSSARSRTTPERRGASFAHQSSPAMVRTRLTAGSPMGIRSTRARVSDSRDQRRAPSAKGWRGACGAASRAHGRRDRFLGAGRRLAKNYQVSPPTGPGPIGMVRFSENAGLVSRYDFLTEGLGIRGPRKLATEARSHAENGIGLTRRLAARTTACG